jgi:hypothetical protein
MYIPVDVRLRMARHICTYVVVDVRIGMVRHILYIVVDVWLGKVRHGHSCGFGEAYKLQWM